MVLSFFAKAGMFKILLTADSLMAAAALFNRFNFNFSRLCKPQRQLIAVDFKFHGVAHRRKLNKRNLRPRNHTHIKKMLPESALSSDFCYDGVFADLKFTEFHMYSP